MAMISKGGGGGSLQRLAQAIARPPGSWSTRGRVYMPPLALPAWRGRYGGLATPRVGQYSSTRGRTQRV